VQERWLEPDAEFCPDKIATNGVPAAPKEDDLEISAGPAGEGKVLELCPLQNQRQTAFEKSVAAMLGLLACGLGAAPQAC
jgi:hypothetical protein